MILQYKFKGDSGKLREETGSCTILSSTQATPS